MKRKSQLVKKVKRQKYENWQILEIEMYKLSTL